MIIFDGYTFAQNKEELLKVRVQELHAKGLFPKIAAILFTEDAGSQLYTQLKKQAAERVGMDYEVFAFSMRDEVSKILEQVRELNNDASVTGIIIQKPWRSRWLEITGASKESFSTWWHQLVLAIELNKDVDGLHPATLQAIEQDTWKQDGRVLPATVKAVLSILETVPDLDLKKSKAIILGKSDILGQPLLYELKNRGVSVEMIGTVELQQRMSSGQKLIDADVVISSTGHAGLITGEMVREGVTVIDVGEPKADVEFATVSLKASFITPVPGGVGPVTVVSLLENGVGLVSSL